MYFARRNVADQMTSLIKNILINTCLFNNNIYIFEPSLKILFVIMGFCHF
jgi:hypothetical protein